MTDLGKVDRVFFEEHIHPYLGADREDVVVGPTHGVDFGLLSVGGRAVVLATDPVSILPALGFDRAARFGLHVVLADVAVSGLAPSHLSISLSLPPSMTDGEFATCWRAIHEECRDLGIAVATGHTARYSGIDFPWVGAATVLAVGDRSDVVRPDGARPGDRLVVTKGPGVEAAGLLTTLFEDRVDLPDDELAAAKTRLADTSPVRDALVAAAAGPVTAMHDATEGGLAGALNELAGAAGVRIDVDGDAVPVLPGVEPACAFFGVDPWEVTSAGTLLLTVDPEGVGDVLAALESEGIPAADVGTIREGEGVYRDGRRLAPPESDPAWDVYAEYAGDAPDGN